MSNSAMLAELASYGFLVIALNHNDKSCSYTYGHDEEVEEEKAPDSISGPQVAKKEMVKRR